MERSFLLEGSLGSRGSGSCSHALLMNALPQLHLAAHGNYKVSRELRMLFGIRLVLPARSPRIKVQQVRQITLEREVPELIHVPQSAQRTVGGGV